MKILILAQTPPPYYGQSIMLQHLVDAKWNWCEKKFIRLDFSKSVEEVGVFTTKKIFSLINIIYKVWKVRMKGKIDILFYPPSGPHKIPFYRDILILLLIRGCTKKIIFQFHAGGFDILYKKLNLLEKILALKIYKNPDGAIILLFNLKDEVNWIKPKRLYIVPNGVEDKYLNLIWKNEDRRIVIITVGMISESKGILIALETARILKGNNFKFIWNFIGNFQNIKINKETEKKISEYNLNDYFNFLGNIHGDEKFNFYSRADIFCFPTFENEAMPLVLLEAMMMSLPIISTNWRGIPNVIDNNKNGLLVPIKNPIKLAEAIEKLINNVELRSKFGTNARKKYLRKFTIEKHLRGMENVFKTIALKNN